MKVGTLYYAILNTTKWFTIANWNSNTPPLISITTLKAENDPSIHTYIFTYVSWRRTNSTSTVRYARSVAVYQRADSEEKRRCSKKEIKIISAHFYAKIMYHYLRMDCTSAISSANDSQVRYRNTTIDAVWMRSMCMSKWRDSLRLHSHQFPKYYIIIIYTSAFRLVQFRYPWL